MREVDPDIRPQEMQDAENTSIPQFPFSEMPPGSGSPFRSGSYIDVDHPGLPSYSSAIPGESLCFPIAQANVLGQGFIGQEGSHAHP